MKNINIKKHIFLALFATALFAACKENIHDFAKKTDSEASNAVYIADSVFRISIHRSADAEVSGVDTILIKFPVHSKLPAENNVKVTLAIDNDLLQIYNAQHGTNYNLLPLSIKHNTLTIPQGETRSRDSVELYYSENLAALDDTKGYLLPVKIATYIGTDVKINYEERLSYLIVNVTQQNGVYFKETESSSKILNNPMLSIFDELDGTPFTLYSLLEANQDVEIKLKANNSLIAEYNARMGTEYLAIPEEDFGEIDITMDAGASQVAGAISYTGNLSTLTDPKGYIVPFEITSVTGNDIKAVNARKVFYAIIDISTLHSWDVTDPAELGTKVTDRTGYSVIKFANANTGAEMNPMNGAGAQNNMFTDNNTQYWLVQQSGIKLDITVDLGAEVQNISGIWMEGFQGNASFNMKEVDIHYATEQEYDAGQSTIIGKIRLTTGRQLMYVKFSEPVNARYIMLNKMTPASMILALRQFYICTE
ncbi:MAG: DUF1735 domain-containing protein [Prevotellaceae bacterium]|jgi:hypothetical protein|nr:DUF1735 domain-containing protein [Prevotellaceae bacterium]